MNISHPQALEVIAVIEQKGRLGSHTEFNRVFQQFFQEEVVVVNRKSLSRDEERLLDPTVALLASITDIKRLQEALTQIPSYNEAQPIIVPLRQLAEIYQNVGKKFPTKFKPKNVTRSSGKPTDTNRQGYHFG